MKKSVQKTFCVSLIALCLCVYLFGQQPSVTGYVTNATGAALPSAYIEIKDSSGRSIASTLSDRAGSFSISLALAVGYTLNAKLEGFSPVSRCFSIQSGATLQLKIQMEPSAVSLVPWPSWYGSAPRWHPRVQRLLFLQMSHVERMEVLEGPSSVLYGQLEPVVCQTS